MAQQNLSPVAKWLSDPGIRQADKDPWLVKDASGLIHCFVQVSGDVEEQALQAAGVTVHTKAGNIWTISLPLSNLVQLSGVKGIAYVDAATRLNASWIKNDREIKQTKADKVHQGTANGLPQNYLGKDVVVGIVDIGFQTDHPTFYNESGTRNRIVRYWHQSYPIGTPPSGYTYGAEHRDSASIEAQPDDDGIHGTHVAGIAAGSGYTTPGLQYRGLAPQADLVFVTIKYSNDTLPGSALGDYIVANPNIIDAYKYIFDYAESVGKPAVINLSWGMHTGPHDGTSLFDKATESLVKHGHILVGANGNEGQNNMHFGHQLSGDTVHTFMIENNRQFRTDERVYSDFWGSAGSDFRLKVSIIDSNLVEVAATDFIAASSDKTHHLSLSSGSDVFKVSFLCEDAYINNNKPNITVMVSNPDQWRYYIRLSATSASSKVDGWNSGAARQWTSGSFTDRVGKANYAGIYKSGNSESTMGENGGTSKAVISVGATAARNSYNNYLGELRDDSWYVREGDLAPFSSRGPTVDGRIKPDIAAPGYDVPSAVNRRQVPGWMLANTVAKTVFRSDTNYWAVASGTSMAAPHAAGIVALVLEANPLLSPEQMRNLLRHTAQQDTFTGTTPNNRFGWGKIDAFEAVKQALYIKLGVNALSAHDRSVMVFPNPAGNSCRLLAEHYREGDALLTLRDMTGREVLQKQVHISGDSHSELLSLESVHAGLYVLSLVQGDIQYSIKLFRTE